MNQEDNTYHCVGPVLQEGETALAVIAAIRQLNTDIHLINRGAYVRVLVPHRCVVTKQAIEQFTHQPFRLPGDLETIMSSFKGTFHVNDQEAVWEFHQ